MTARETGGHITRSIQVHSVMLKSEMDSVMQKKKKMSKTAPLAFNFGAGVQIPEEHITSLHFLAGLHHPSPTSCVWLLYYIAGRGLLTQSSPLLRDQSEGSAAKKQRESSSPSQGELASQKKRAQRKCQAMPLTRQASTSHHVNTFHNTLPHSQPPYRVHPITRLVIGESNVAAVVLPSSCSHQTYHSVSAFSLLVYNFNLASCASLPAPWHEGNENGYGREIERRRRTEGILRR